MISRSQPNPKACVFSGHHAQQCHAGVPSLREMCPIQAISQIVSVVNNVSSLKFGSQTQLAASSSPFTGQADGSRIGDKRLCSVIPLPALEKGLSDLQDTSTPFSVSAPPGGHAGMQTQDCPRVILFHPSSSSTQNEPPHTPPTQATELNSLGLGLHS